MFDIKKIEDTLGFQFKNQELLKTAYCHKSFFKENPEWPHNEKLEFLGDAVLDLVLSDLLMQKFAEDSEGSLSRKRASIVNEASLCQLAKSLDMDQYLLIGERERNSNLRQNSRILASVFEAVVGAIYKDSGFQASFDWIQATFKESLSQTFENHDYEQDYKTRFQEWVQEVHKTTPIYKVISQSGPDHDRVFEVEVFINNESWGRAIGSSKKAAAQNAAEQALKRSQS